MSETLEYENFLSRSARNTVRAFKDYDEKYYDLARDLVPWDHFKAEYIVYLAQCQELLEAAGDAHGDGHGEANADGEDENIVDEMDYLLVKLLSFFKTDLFTWVDQPECEACKRKGCFKERRNRIGPGQEVTTVEVYRCPGCGGDIEFARLNHGGMLLETRRGRCGEWARAFAFICHVFGYQVRLVYHYEDHVWTEVYSSAQSRWMHADPCENALDTPFLYECGWGKKATLIIAVGMHEIRDVTWRYAPRWKETVMLRSRLFKESIIAKTIERINQVEYFARMPEATLRFIQTRWLSELSEFIRGPDQDDLSEGRCFQGRTSGSLAWRLSRGETQTQHNQGYIFKLSPLDRVTYDCSADCYKQQSCTDQPQVKGWAAGTYTYRNIARKVESDWCQCYLARCESSSGQDQASITWRFQLPQEWTHLEVHLHSVTFDCGKITLTLRLDTGYVQEFQGHVSVSKVPGAKWAQVEALITGGSGAVAWQHAQLFRQPSNDSSSKVTFDLKLR